MFILPMIDTSSISTPSLSLDITQEKRALLVAIEENEKKYQKVFDTLESLKQEISEFQKTYDLKIRHLYERLNELESLIFKYQNMSEYVDDIFSFSDVQKIFDDTMKDRQARMEDDFWRQKRIKKNNERRNALSDKDRKELKRFYRNLAHLFHPDKTGGNDEMMKRINKAYIEGNLEELRDLDVEHVPLQEDNSFNGLKQQLLNVIRMIEKVNRELVSLKRSDMNILRKNMLKPNPHAAESRIDGLANQLKKEIERKEYEVDTFVKKFGNYDKEKV